MTKEEIAEDVARTSRYLDYHGDSLIEWFALQGIPNKLEIFDSIDKTLKDKYGILEGDSNVAKMTESEMLKLADLQPVEYSGGENRSIRERCPEGKTIYTLLDGEGTSCYYKVGLFCFDRLGVYFGNDLGYVPGTIFS